MEIPRIESNARMRGGAGYLMIDLLITMAVVTMLFSISSVWIHKTFLYCATVNQRDSHHRNISRLGRQLRIDAALAQSIENDGDSVTLKVGDSETTYKINANTMFRNEDNGSIAKVDRFEFAKNTNLAWIGMEKPNSLTLEISRDLSQLTVDKKASRKLDVEIFVRAGRANEGGQ